MALAGLGALALGAGWFLSSDQGDDRNAGVSGSLAFPGLAARLQGVKAVDIDHQGKTLRLALAGDVWGLPAKGGYPIQQNKLHELLTGLTELRLTEPRTSDPAEYARLGVEDPNGTAATGSQLRVIDESGADLAELVVGHRRVRTQTASAGGNIPETVYVRRPGEAQSWLAEGRLEVDADPQQWIDRDIANIDHTKIANVTVTQGDQLLVFARQGDAFVLISPADHPKLDEYKVDDVARALETLTLLDVKPAAQEPGDRIGSALFTTTDGETISASLFKVASGEDPEIWAQFTATGTDASRGASGGAADALEKRVHGWAYQIGAWKEAAFLPTLEALKATEPSPPSAPLK